MAKKVFELAKELNIDHRAIVAKCRAEGIPETVVKTHMSPVSAGLEATIREWFAGGVGGGTAVETADKIDIETVKIKPKRAASKAAKASPSKVDVTPDEAERPADHARPVDHAEAAGPTPIAAATAPAPETRPVEPIAPASKVDGDETHKRAAKKASPSHEESAVDPKPATAMKATSAPAAKAAGPSAMPGPSPTKIELLPKDATAPSSGATGGEASTDRSGGDGESAALRPAATASPAPTPAPMPVPTRTVIAAPQNVPTRPKIVTPAGPKLQVQTPVKLSGPKVVRVEAPEVIAAPRPRRVGSGESSGGSGIATSRGPRGGGGVTGGTEEDRRGGRGASGPGAAARRSSGQGVPDRRKGRVDPFAGGGPITSFTEQDLAEREARLNRSLGFLKKRRQDLKKTGAQPGMGEKALSAAETGGMVKIAAPFTIKDLSAATGVKGADIVKKLFLQGVMATINSGIDPAKAQEIMIDFDIELEVTEAKSAEQAVSAEFLSRDRKDERPRGPVVTILGHVDHGKTSLLDKIRNANVAAGEAGGITQKTSAFRVPITVAGEEKQVVFLDTPGHQAFTSMRARGANMTDVVVLVVSAPEGVMPQTIESINHAKAAKVPIVVALNKIDRPDATENAIRKVMSDLATAGLNPVEWGGDTEIVKTSATTGQGIKELLEVLDLQSQILELKADFAGACQGSVIEARTEAGRGAVASLLVQEGKLSVGDYLVAGRAFGRIRDITDDRGNKIKEATPPMPVQISGIDLVPDAGDKFYVVDSLRKAQDAAEQRRQRERETQLAQPKLTLDSLFTQIQDKSVKEILVVLKAAEQGTVDVLKSEIEKIGGGAGAGAEVKCRVLQAAVGGITESDVILAAASKAIVIGFNVIPSGKARTLAESKGVEIRSYEVIYDITDDLKKVAEGQLAPELKLEVLGHAEVRQVFKVTKVGTIAGCYITDGIVQRDALIRVTRNDIVIENNRKLEQLKRFKDDAKEVRAGMECGMKIVGYDDIKQGDILECYKQVEVKRTL